MFAKAVSKTGDPLGLKKIHFGNNLMCIKVIHCLEKCYYTKETNALFVRDKSAYEVGLGLAIAEATL